MKGILFALCAFLLVACSEREKPESAQEKVGTNSYENIVVPSPRLDGLGKPPSERRWDAAKVKCAGLSGNEKGKCYCESFHVGDGATFRFPNGETYTCH